MGQQEAGAMDDPGNGGTVDAMDSAEAQHEGGRLPTGDRSSTGTEGAHGFKPPPPKFAAPPPRERRQGAVNAFAMLLHACMDGSCGAGGSSQMHAVVPGLITTCCLLHSCMHSCTHDTSAS